MTPGPQLKDNNRHALERALGAPLPAGLANLDSAALQKLDNALQRARKSQRAQMATATESSLQYVPFLLRGTVKKVLGIK